MYVKYNKVSGTIDLSYCLINAWLCVCILICDDRKREVLGWKYKHIPENPTMGIKILTLVTITLEPRIVPRC